MLDSPKDFLLLIIAFILALTLIIAGKNSVQNELAKESNLNVSIEDQKKASTQTGEKTTTKTPAQIGITKPDVIDFPNSITPSVSTDHVVLYTNTGFQPQKLTIKTGKSVRFFNNSSASMYIAGATSPNQTGISGFNQGRSVGKDGFYDFTFNKKGSFIYYNNNKRADVGLITVE